MPASSANMRPDQIVRKPKKLIVCCDGTWMDSDNGIVNEGTWIYPKWELQTPSNVTRIARAILAEDAKDHQQIIYYHAGVGCGSNWLDKVMGGGTGAGLSENVREGYSFLANNYTPGDLIYLIGFSRGAFTARSIAGLIGGMGLLTKDGLPYFYRVFEDFSMVQHAGQDDYEPSIKIDLPEFEIDAHNVDIPVYLDQYKRELLHLRGGLTRDVKVKAIGVWDTVGALGIPTTAWLQSLGVPAFLHPLQPYRFMNTSLGNHIENAFQALALDERRTAYSPAVWDRQPGSTTNLKQVWFPGVHSNIGGSYEDTGLSDITLAWMMDQLESTGIEFDRYYLLKAWASNQTFYNIQNAEAVAAYHRTHTLPILSHNGYINGDINGNGNCLNRLNRRPTPYPTLNPRATPATRHRHTTKHNSDNLDPTGPHWALTRLYNSADSLTCLAGVAPRTPGLYTATDYMMCNQVSSKPMLDTRETVHCSVRVRLMSNRGHSYDGKGKYGAVALVKNGYVLEGPDGPFRDEVETNGVQRRESGWRWVRYKVKGRGNELKVERVLPEEPLGRFERMLLGCDQEMSAQVLGTE